MQTRDFLVYCTYPAYSSLENGVNQLKAAGFSNTDISVLFPEKAGTTAFATEQGTSAPTATGAGSGAVLGGALGWLAGIGLLAIPGLGPFVAAGPLMAALAGAGGGAVIGGIAGALVGMGIPEESAKIYESHINRGGILCSVHAQDLASAARAREIMEHTGAQNITAPESRAA